MINLFPHTLLLCVINGRGSVLTFPLVSIIWFFHPNYPRNSSLSDQVRFSVKQWIELYIKKRLKFSNFSLFFFFLLLFKELTCVFKFKAIISIFRKYFEYINLPSIRKMLKCDRTNGYFISRINWNLFGSIFSMILFYQSNIWD